ncbi:MAG: SurA N-terminal domain-containing protein [Halioglobus sp.]
MLQDIRSKVQGPVVKVIVWLIVISFSIFGIESILVGGGGSGVAEVNGEEITPQELEQALNTQQRRLIAAMGDNFDPAMLEDDALKSQVLNSLIDRKLLMQSATDLSLSVSNKELGGLIGSMEQFQIEGVFSPELYRSLLSSAGFTPGYFKNSLQEDVTLSQLRSGLGGTEFVTPLELGLNARFDAEQRDLNYLTIPLAKFLDGLSVNDAQIEEYYAGHQDEFRTPESVELDYIELTPQMFMQPVEESAILEAYQLEVENGQYKTENRVAHILFETRDGEDDAALQERIAAAREKLSTGVAFSDVAAEFSDDVGSAASGGDLGFSSGDAFPEAMEEAIATLGLNEVSAPIQTDAGTHLVIVTERKEGKAPQLEELRPRLEQDLQLSKAREALLLAVEALKDLVFNAEDLAGPARELKLEVARSEPVARDQADGLFAAPALLSAAFSEEVIDQGHNSDVIELADDKFVVLRAHKHNAPQVRALAEVREEIVTILRDQAARALAAAEAERLVGELAAGATVEQLAGSGGYEWHAEPGANRRNAALPREVIGLAFEMPAPAQGEILADFVMTPAGDVQVILLERVNPGRLENLEQEALLALRRQSSVESANLLDTEFQQSLRANAEISVL